MSFREGDLVEACGLALGGVGYGDRDGGRLWFEAEAAFGLPFLAGLGVRPGLGVGATAEVDPVRRPRWGWQATLWMFAGIVPFFRVGALNEHGVFTELGIMLKLPLGFRY